MACNANSFHVLTKCTIMKFYSMYKKILMMIRGNTIKYGSERGKKIKGGSTLKEDLKRFENELCDNVINILSN